MAAGRRSGGRGALGPKTPGGPSVLLAACVLSFCFQLAGAQSMTITITVDPPTPIEGGSVTLTPSPFPENTFSCRWYRGKRDDNNLILITYFPPLSGQQEGPKYTGRETVSSDGSLHITNLNVSDSGIYSFSLESPKAFGYGEVDIVVSEKLTQPILSPPKYMPLEKENVTLTCETSVSSTVTVSWLKDGQPVPDHAKLSGDNRTLTLYGFTKADDGNYTCVASNHLSNATSNASVITMAYGPDKVKINQSEDISVVVGSPLVLLCSADSNPAAQFQWFVNKTDQNVTEDTFRVDSMTWDDGGNYTCQAHNTRTNLSSTASITVRLTYKDGPKCNGLCPGQIAGIVIGCLAAAALIGGVIYYVCTKTSLGRTERHASNGNIPSAPGHNQGVTDTKPRTGEEDIQYSTLAFKANNPQQPAPGATQPSDSSNIIYSEIKKK